MAHRTEDLVERQVRFWRVQAKAQTTPDRTAPCVALSRLPGSGATELGRRVAERLGYGFFGIEIVDEIARDQGISRRLVEDLDEHVRSAIDRYASDAVGASRFTESDYLHSLVRTIVRIGERGGAVLVGRGAAFILPPERALRVLLIAPQGVRAARLAQARGLSIELATRQIVRDDADRLAFLQHHFGRDPDDAEFYDLSLNTGTLSMDDACALVVEALDRRFPGAGAVAASRRVSTRAGSAERIE